MAHMTKVHVGVTRRISHVVDAATADTVTNSTPLCCRGVSLAFLRAFLAQMGVGARTTTGEVCERFIKPATARLQCAYFDMVAGSMATFSPADGEPSWTGESHYFLSHVRLHSATHAHATTHATNDCP